MSKVTPWVPKVAPGVPKVTSQGPPGLQKVPFLGSQSHSMKPFGVRVRIFFALYQPINTSTQQLIAATHQPIDTSTQQPINTTSPQDWAGGMRGAIRRPSFS